MLQVDQRHLGATEIVVPPLGIGVWSWGDKSFWGYGSTHTQDDVYAAYQACVSIGLNFFDTAEIYGSGESERLLGECFRKDKRPIIIASKFAPMPTRLSAKSVLTALDASLERLGVTSIDLYQIHWPFTLLKTNDLMDALAQAVRAGKVRAVGVSNYGADHMRKAYERLARHDIPLASNQVHYSLLHRKPEKNGVLDACRELNVTLIAYSPLEQGVLIGKYRPTNATRIAPGGPRRFIPAFGAANQRKIEPMFQVIEPIAKAHGKTIGQVAINWLVSKDSCIVPIPGAKNVRQAQENAGAIGWSLTQEEHDQISRAARF